MKRFQKIITLLALSVLVILIVGGIYFINRPKANNSFKFVPENATTVAFIKPENIANDFYQLLKRNPTLLDSSTNTKIDVKAIQSNMGGNGLNPLVDAVLYTFLDDNEHLYFGVICNIIDENKFIKSLTKNPELIQRNILQEGEIIQLEKENFIIIKKGNDAILLQNLEKNEKTNTTIATQQYELIFSKNAKSLIENNSDFSLFIEQKNHLGIWSKSVKSSLTKYFDLFFITKQLSDKTISLTSKKEDVNIQSVINILDSSILTPKTENKIDLNDVELAKFSLSTSPNYLKDIFEKILQKKQHYLLDYCTGSFCSSIIGYRETPVYKTSVKQAIDPETFETVEVADTVEASPVFNIPEIMHALTINNSNALFKTLNSDSLIQNETGYWIIPHPFFVNENLYLTLKNDILFIGTNKKFDAINPQFSTFSFLTNIPKTIESYPPKDAVQRFGMAAIPEIKISTIEINFNKIENNKLYLDGAMNTTDTTQHSMLTIAGEALKLRGILKGFI